MSTFTVTLSDEMQKRLEALAAHMEQSVADCAQQAILEFVDNWEDHQRVVAALQEDEARPILRSVTAADNS
jgi:predicted transcriptional regulator